VREAGAILEGHFQLSTGRHSGTYVDKLRLLEQPLQTEGLCRMIAHMGRPNAPRGS